MQNFLLPKIQDKKLKMNSFWIAVNECELEDDFILHSLLKNFEVKKSKFNFFKKCYYSVTRR